MYRLFIYLPVLGVAIHFMNRKFKSKNEVNVKVTTDVKFNKCKVFGYNSLYITLCLKQIKVIFLLIFF